MKGADEEYDRARDILRPTAAEKLGSGVRYCCRWTPPSTCRSQRKQQRFVKAAHERTGHATGPTILDRRRLYPLKAHRIPQGSSCPALSRRHAGQESVPAASSRLSSKSGCHPSQHLQRARSMELLKPMVRVVPKRSCLLVTGRGVHRLALPHKGIAVSYVSTEYIFYTYRA